MRYRTLKYMIPVAGLLFLGSCHMYKEYQLPESSSIVNDYKYAEEHPDSTQLAYMGWEEVFTDPQLQTLIRRALDANKDIDNARLNIEMAQAQLQGAKLSYYPSLMFNPSGGTASYGGSHMDWSYTLPLVASWEVDVFGRLLNTKRQAQVKVEQSEDYYQASRSQIVCAVANTYYALVWLNQQLDLTRNTADVWNEQVESMRLLKEAGRVNEAAVVQSEANYYSILSNIPDLEMSIAQMQNTMSLLLGTYPATWEVSQNLDFNLPSRAESGIPLYYLAVRPDVRAAERSMASAYYATNLARANFYPNLTISAQGGFTNAVGSFITNPGKWFIQLAGQLSAPIFSRGKNIAQLRAAEAQQKVALNTFENTVLGAAADVSDAMVKIKKNEEKRQQLMKQINSLEKSVEYTQELLLYGQSTYLEVLTARSQLLSAQLNNLTAMHEKVSALISLYQAVGGGY